MRLRNSGIDILGEVPWGTHLCQFYKTRDDLLDVLAPYFKAGLEGNEFCMWITSDPLTVDDALGAMRGVMPSFDELMSEGRMEILPHTDWYMKDGYFDLKRVIDGWIDKLADAQGRGLAGLRATGNTTWLGDTDWDDFTEYEEALDAAIGDYPVMVLCTYSLDKCGASEVIDVFKNHRYALIKKEGAWALIESSERKKAEAEFRTVVKAAMDGFWITNDEGRFIDVNDSYCRLVGYSRDELREMCISDIEALEDPGDTEAHIRLVAEHGLDLFETRHRRKDGSIVDVEVSVNYLDMSGGRLYVFVRDITERKAAEKELLKVNAELDGYAHAVSHDLRGPLAAIALAEQLMRDVQGSEQPPEIAEEAALFSDTVKRNLARCDSLIGSMLTLAEAGQVPERTEEVDIGAIVQRVAEERMFDIYQSGVKLVFEPDLGTVEASPTHMYQLFSNLINNGIKHNDAEKPVVNIEYLGRDDGGGMRYRVRDNGSGIPAEDMERIFVPFFKRGEKSDTGIGLATVEKIVKVYNGEIRAFNDKGACFELVLRSL